MITFDDGFADFADNAWPELTQRGLAATLYVTAGTLGGRSEWLAPLGAGGLADAEPRAAASTSPPTAARSAPTA